jgi:hypothetical protein
VLALKLFEPWPALAAIALLVSFAVVIVLRLLDGRRPTCAWFGSRAKRPLCTYHVLRNLGLLCLAVVAAVWA